MRTAALALALTVTTLAAWPTPPLRIAVPAGPDGLATAGAWAELAVAYRASSGVELELAIVEDDRAVLAALREKTAEIGVVDTFAYLGSPSGLAVLGVGASYGRPYERLAMIVGADTIIHRPEDLWRARIVAVGPPEGLAWGFALAWARGFAPAVSWRGVTLHERGYEGALKAVALGLADAGFVPETLLGSIRVGQLAARVRVVASAGPFPLTLLAVRSDLSAERNGLAMGLIGLTGGDFALFAPPSDLAQVLASLGAYLDVARP